ncbi:MAG: hypothetical protein ABSH28_22470 [Acidobacteriota bacterium]
MIDFQIVCMSHKRAERMPHLLKLIPTIKIFVADGEADTYLAAGVPKDKLLTHPNLVGFGRIRGYMDEHTPNEVIVHIDDDLQAINVWSGSGYNVIRDHETIDRVVYVTIQAAMDLGVSIFGWGRRGTPAYFTQNEPFSLKEPASAACMGQIGRQFKFDPNLVGFLEDADLTLQALLKERIIFIDTRYYWHFGKSWGNKGGAQAVRSSQVRMRDVEYIKQKWGRYIECQKKSRGETMSYRITVKRRVSY